MFLEPNRSAEQTCGICGEGIRMDLRGISLGLEMSGEIARARREAVSAHMQQHSEQEIRLHLMRQLLEHTPESKRLSVVKKVYRELGLLDGAEDTRGVYSIEEVLGSAVIYRFWHDANTWHSPVEEGRA